MPKRQVMDFLYKIENFVNKLLLKFGAKILSLIPPKVLSFFENFDEKFFAFIAYLKKLASLLVEKFPGFKAKALTFDFKGKILDPFRASLARYNQGQKEKAGQLKIIVLTPFLLFLGGVKGLSPWQSLILLFFTGASILSSITIISSSHRLMNGNEQGRSPASAEEVTYDRPVYYKKEQKHFSLTNLRLPVYIPEVNELRSVDIDFIATTSTRESRMYLEIKEFQLRDHLILEIEPSVASFPLTEEGKDIIRNKIKNEVDAFLKDNNIPGKVEEVKVIYILAN